MKICWDMLENVRLTKKGNFRKGDTIYIYKESCVNCKESYLAIKCNQSKFCSISCGKRGKNNPNYGKHHTVEVRRKMSRNRRDYGGFLNPNYKGGVAKSGLTIYETYRNVLGLYEDVRKQGDTELLEAKCAYCGQWYIPTRIEVRNRLFATNTLNQGEQRLYCSENCKQACPTFGKKIHPKGFKKATSREVSTYLRQMVFERDNWECQKCGKTIKDIQLHCHHMDPVSQNPVFQNDMNSCITLCKDCHKMVHKQYGCRYVDLRCKKDS